MLSWSAVIDNGKSKLGRLHWVLRQLLVGDGSGVIPGGRGGAQQAALLHTA